MSEEVENHKKKMSFLKKFSIIIAIVLGLLTLFVAYQAYMYANPLARINFTTFAPAGGEVESARLYIRTHYIGSGEGRQDTFVFPEITMYYQSEGMKISLEKDHGFSYDCKQNYAVECEVRETERGQKYIYANDPQSGPEGGVSFAKDGTEVYIEPVDTKKTFTEDEWNDFIDSLQPTKFENIEIRRVSHGI